MKKERYDLIEQATELFKMRMISETECEGLLYPKEHGGIWSYGRPAVSYYGTVSYYKDLDKWLFHSAIHSSDDSSVAFHSNYETKEKAMKQFQKFVDWITSLQYACPNRQQVEAYCKMYGFTASYN